MKKLFVSIAAMTMLLATGCQNEELVQQGNSGDYTLTLDMGAQSRTMHDENGNCVWGENEAIYVVGEGGKVFGTLTMKSKSEDGKKAVFSGKVTGDPAKLQFMVYPVPEADGTIPMGNIDGTNHNAPMTGSISGGVVNDVDYAGGLIQVPVNGVNGMEVSVTDGNGKVVTGGGYTFNPTDGTLTFNPNSGSVMNISNVSQANGIVYIPVDADNQKENVTVEITIGKGTNNQSQSFEAEIQEGAITVNGIPSIDVNEEGVIGAVVKNEKELRAALSSSGEIRLGNNIEITYDERAKGTSLIVPAGIEIILDMNDFILKNPVEGASALVNNGTLTINNGTIKNENTAAQKAAAIQNFGRLVLNEVNAGSDTNRGAAVENTAGTTEINGGLFATVDRVYQASFGNGDAFAYVFINKEGTMTINDAEVDCDPNGVFAADGGKIIVNDGTYTMGDPQKNTYYMAYTEKGTIELKGGEYNWTKGLWVGSATYGNVIIDYVNCDCNWVTKVTTAADLDSKLLGGEEVLLLNDIEVSANETNANSGYGSTGFSVKEGAVLHGNDKILIVNDANGTWDCAVNPHNGTVEDLTINGSFRGIFMSGASGDVFIDNVVLDDVCYTFNSDAGNKEYGVYISNSTLNGWTSFSDVHKEVIFKNCKFGKGTGGYEYAFCRPYNACVFENCEFEKGFEFDTRYVGEILFKNCTYGDVKITAENAAELAEGEIIFFYKGVNSATFE